MREKLCTQSGYGDLNKSEEQNKKILKKRVFKQGNLKL